MINPTTASNSCNFSLLRCGLGSSRGELELSEKILTHLVYSRMALGGVPLRACCSHYQLRVANAAYRQSCLLRGALYFAMGRTTKTKKGNRKGATAQTKKISARSADGASTSSTSAPEAQEEPEASTSELDMSQLTMDTSFDSSVSERSRETVGVSGQQFLNGRHDFRAFGRATWRDLVGSSVVDNLWAQLTAYSKSKTAYAKAKVLVSADELPLSFAAQMMLEHRVQAVRAVLVDLAQRYEEERSMNKITTFTEDKVGARYFGQASKEVGAAVHSIWGAICWCCIQVQAQSQRNH
jgi:hypothetical protein